MDYKKSYELERSRRIAAEARLRSIYSSPFLKLIRGNSSVRHRIHNFVFNSLRDINNEETNLKVEDQLKGKFSITRGSSWLSSDSVALIAQWSKSTNLTLSNKTLIMSLMDAGFSVILISANDSNEIELDPEMRERIILITKPNIGYDFGSWLTAIMAMPEINLASEVILTNDSFLGPFTEIGSLIQEIRLSPFDVTSITDSNKYSYHLQSYFLHFKSSSFGSAVVQNFMHELKIFKHKFEFVSQYELEFTRSLQVGGLRAGAIYPWNAFCLPWENPTLDQAETLIKAGLPFLKREYIRLSTPAQVESICLAIKNNFPNAINFLSEIEELA